MYILYETITSDGFDKKLRISIFSHFFGFQNVSFDGL